MPGHDGAPGPQGIPGCNGTKVRIFELNCEQIVDQSLKTRQSSIALKTTFSVY